MFTRLTRLVTLFYVILLLSFHAISAGIADDSTLYDWETKDGFKTTAAFHSVDVLTNKVTLLVPKDVDLDRLSANSLEQARMFLAVQKHKVVISKRTLGVLESELIAVLGSKEVGGFQFRQSDETDVLRLYSEPQYGLVLGALGNRNDLSGITISISVTDLLYGENESPPLPRMVAFEKCATGVAFFTCPSLRSDLREFLKKSLPLFLIEKKEFSEIHRNCKLRLTPSIKDPVEKVLFGIVPNQCD